MRVIGVGMLVAALLGGATRPAAADATGQSPGPRRSGGQHRVLWTTVGAGAGFAAGLFLGLRWFDDAIDSERKIFTLAAILGAGGAVAGNLVARGERAAARPGAPQAAPGMDWRQNEEFAQLARRLRPRHPAE